MQAYDEVSERVIEIDPPRETVADQLRAAGTVLKWTVIVIVCLFVGGLLIPIVMPSWRLW